MELASSDLVGSEIGLAATPDRRKSRSGLGRLAAPSVDSAPSVGSAGSEGHERRRRRKECEPPSTTTKKAGVIGGCMKSPTVSCTSKVPTRRVSFTSADSGSTGKSAADSGSSSLQDSSPSKEPTSNRKAIVPPPPNRISNGDIGDGKLASQGHVSRLQPYTPPSPLAMAGRSGPAEESPLVVRSACLKRCPCEVSPPCPARRSPCLCRGAADWRGGRRSERQLRLGRPVLGKHFRLLAEQFPYGQGRGPPESAAVWPRRSAR